MGKLGAYNIMGRVEVIVTEQYCITVWSMKLLLQLESGRWIIRSHYGNCWAPGSCHVSSGDQKTTALTSIPLERHSMVAKSILAKWEAQY